MAEPISAAARAVMEKVLKGREERQEQGDPLWPTKSTDTGRGNQYSADHPARDIVGRSGDPIVSSVAGRIVGPVIYDPAYGLNVSVLAEGGPLKGYTFHYSHLSGLVDDLKVGARVKAGEYLGMVGSTGRSTGPHLDFEVYNPQGRRIDPLTVEWAGFKAPSSVPKLSEHQVAEAQSKRGRSSGADYFKTSYEQEKESFQSRYDPEVKKERFEQQKETFKDRYAPENAPLWLQDFKLAMAGGEGVGYIWKAAAFAIAGLVFVVALAALLGRSKAGKVARVAAGEGVGLIPGVGQAKSVAKIAKAAGD